MTYDYLTVDLWNREVIPKIQAVQNDTGRGVIIDTGLTGTYEDSAYAYVKKGDGHKVFNNATIDDSGVVTVNFSQQMLAYAGEALLQIDITRGAKRVSSHSIIVEIAPSIIDEGALPSTDEFGALETALNEAQTSLENSEQAINTANAAAAAANQAAADANAGAAAANQAAADANAGAAAANDAAADANAGAAAANDAAADANAGAAAANDAAAIAGAAAANITTQTQPFNVSGIVAADNGFSLQTASKYGNIVTVDIYGKNTAEWGQWYGIDFTTAFNALPAAWRNCITNQIFLDVYRNGSFIGNIYIGTNRREVPGAVTGQGSWFVRATATNNAVNVAVNGEISIHGSWVVVDTV